MNQILMYMLLILMTNDKVDQTQTIKLQLFDENLCYSNNICSDEIDIEEDEHQ